MRTGCLGGGCSQSATAKRRMVPGKGRRSVHFDRCTGVWPVSSRCVQGPPRTPSTLVTSGPSLEPWSGACTSTSRIANSVIVATFISPSLSSASEQSVASTSRNGKLQTFPLGNFREISFSPYLSSPNLAFLLRHEVHRRTVSTIPRGSGAVRSSERAPRGVLGAGLRAPTLSCRQEFGADVTQLAPPYGCQLYRRCRGCRGAPGQRAGPRVHRRSPSRRHPW